ncbi:hypothetical protein ENSA7_10010 [Enhygromyxa salina]|uniref:Uncharacterized protein n=1 Tax=Enhygromyxa salina TaxID=215803 RepID=A0A2S9YW90_9BACT|nr:hypothetical protein ENSA7_10010 [Enhygromyxa salina]
MIVVTNRIPVAQGHEIDFEDRFRKRVHLVCDLVVSPPAAMTRSRCQVALGYRAISLP